MVPISKLPRLVFLGALALAGCAKGHGCGSANATAIDAQVSARVIRSPAEIRRDGNALATSASEYLREHGHDPVDWHAWSDRTLALAVAENKPIFLSIGYSACHFCHVMHDEVFAKDDVAEALNAHFIAIKVDREERPDLDATYIAALTRMSGSAGWPASLFLTPTLDPFFGATYVPHDRFLQLLGKIDEAWANRDAGTFQTIALADLVTDHAPEQGTALSPDEIKALATDIVARMDPIRGGLKSTTKFPMPPRLRFLLHATRKWNLPELVTALKTTLDAMMSGALRDPISGGFHRYTTDADWTTPHYEVMLYDDAQLASLYLEAAAAFEEPRYLTVAKELLDFLASDLRLESGAFAASFDADTKGEEGAAWEWSADEITKVVGAADAPAVSAWLGIENEKRAPSRRTTIAEVAKRTKTSENAVAAAWNRARPLLRAARAGVAQRDDKVVAAWNGLAIEAFSAGFLATGDPHYRDVAVAAADSIWSDHRDGQHLLTRTSGGAAAFTADDGDLAVGYLALFQVTAAPRFLTRAELLLRDALSLEAPGGGFFDGRSSFSKTVSLDDGVEPSGTAAVLHALLERNALSPADVWSTSISRALGKYGTALREEKWGAAGWLDAALLDAGPTYDAVISGPEIDAAPLFAVPAQLLPPWSVVLRIPAAGADADLLKLLPALAGKSATSGARAFVCERAQCKAPTSDPKVMRDQLLTGWPK